MFQQRGGFQLFQGAAELVGTGGAFRATANAVQAEDDVVNLLASHQLADALQVAVAATKEEYLLDDVVLVGSHVNQLRTRAVRLVLYVLRFHVLSQFLVVCRRVINDLGLQI